MPYAITTYSHLPLIINDASETSAGVMTAADFLKLQGIISGGEPSLTLGEGAGGGEVPPHASLIHATNASGEISLTTGTGPMGSATILILHFNPELSGTPKVLLTPASATAAALNDTQQVYVDAATDASAFSLMSGSVGLAATTTYKWWYACFVG